MRVLIDGIVFENNYQRGIQRIFREVLARIIKTESLELFLSSQPRSTLPVGCPVTYRRERFGAAPKNYPLRAWRKLKRRIAPTRFTGHTLFHSSFFTRSPEPGLPEVVTVYDVIAEKFDPLYHYWGQAHIDNKRRCMEAARRIMCISQATADDVAEIYPHLADRLCAVHPGADHFAAEKFVEEKEGSISGLESGPPYLLQVGDRHNYKNFGVLLKAMAEQGWPAEVRLRVTGAPPSAEEQAEINRLNLQSRITFDGVVSDAALRELYCNAAGFVFPSLYEGFGFPLLEAQIAGAPVLCSDIPVFRETAGESAIFFDPNNPASLAACTEELLNGKAQALRAAGTQNVKRFTWDQSARLTVEVYRSVSA